MGRPPKTEDEQTIRIAARTPKKMVNYIDKLAEEHDRDRSGEINHALRFYVRYSNEAAKLGMTPDELEYWIYQEFVKLSKRMDEIEEKMKD